MPLLGLTIIGESINDSVPSTHKLYEANDIAGLKELARSQDIGGATYIDVNVGKQSADFLAEMFAKSRASPPNRFRLTRPTRSWPRPRSKPTTVNAPAAGFR